MFSINKTTKLVTKTLKLTRDRLKLFKGLSYKKRNYNCANSFPSHYIGSLGEISFSEIIKKRDIKHKNTYTNFRGYGDIGDVTINSKYFIELKTRTKKE